MRSRVGPEMFITVERLGLAASAAVALIAVMWTVVLIKNVNGYFRNVYRVEAAAATLLVLAIVAVYVVAALIWRHFIVSRWTSLRQPGRQLVTVMLLMIALVGAMFTAWFTIESINPMTARCNLPLECAKPAS